MATQRKFKLALLDAEKKLEKARGDLKKKQEQVQGLIRTIPKLQCAVDSLRELCGQPRSPKLDSSAETSELTPLPAGMVKAETCEHGVVKGEECPQCRRAAQPIRTGMAAKGVIRGDPSFHEDSNWEGVGGRKQ